MRVFVLILGLLGGLPAMAQFYTRDHIVVDLVQKIDWLRCSVGQRWDPNEKFCVGKVLRLSHEEIEQAIAQANAQLGGSWRLPTRKELESILCHDCTPVKIDPITFPNTSAEPYWTSDINWISPRNRWSVSFMTGDRYGRFFPEQQLAVRLVSDKD
jgi:hypothetical protein